MATNTFVEIDIPEAAELADLTGIQRDFESTKQFAAKLAEIWSSERPDFTLIEALTTAPLVRYSRPFLEGVRKWFSKMELESLTPEQRAAHEHFRLWRSKHIAHSANVFEDNQPIARYWVERFDVEGFTSVECNSNIVAGMSASDIRAIIELADHFINKLKPLIEAEKQRVLSVVRGLPRQNVLAMKKPPRVPQAGDVAKHRKKVTLSNRSKPRT
ncbi:MAG: hypothetical protein HZB57_06330 [Gammaproteobacteria bacterium]|nr:hypothetical protein [Gammaproteobacteria bacterium]